MKLWKILLAAIVAVLMISCVAMAEECDHNWYVANRGEVTTTLRTETQHTFVYEDAVWACTQCSATKVETDYITGNHGENNKVVVKEPTCGTKGEYKFTCNACGKEWKKELPVTGESHTYPNYKTVIEEANCLEDGFKSYVCLVCGHVSVTHKESIPATPNVHKWDEGVVVKPTCASEKSAPTNGYTLQTCTVCKLTQKVNWTACTPVHKTKVVTEKTCTTDGLKVWYCATCGVEFDVTEVIPKSHNTEKIEPKASTCKDQGWYGYRKCKDCNKLFNYEGNKELDEIPYRPVNENDHEVLENGWKYEYVASCTSTLNYKWANCIVCGKYLEEKLPAGTHKFADPAKLSLYGPGTYAGIGVVTKQATCDENGEGYVVCVNCTAQKFTTEIPARGHKFGDWLLHTNADCTTEMTAVRICKYNNAHKEYKVLGAALGHKWETKVEKDPTCTENGSGYRKCVVCQIEEIGVVIPAPGHDYTEKVTAATCTKDGKIVKTCSVCKDKVTEKIPAAHGATKEVVATKPACGVAGTMNVVCTVCDATVATKEIAALKHEYEWKVISKPSAAGNGRNEYKCNLCGDVAEVKTIKYSKYYYNNTMTSFGPMTKELVGGNDWYRVTPVDVTVDGVYTYDLIASNKYVVGTVTISVNAGTLTVSYKVKNNVDVKDESLLIYASKADLAAGSAVTAPVGAAINVAETFGADGKVLVSLILTGDYDAAGKDLVNDAAAAGMIANID